MDDPQEAFSVFYSRDTNLYCDCFPPKKVRSRYNNRKFWLTIGLKSSIKHKNKLFLKQIKHKNNYNECVYKKYRNKLTNISQAEKQHHDNVFATHTDNLNTTWKTIKLNFNKHKNVAKASTFVINNKQVKDPKEIADDFNNFFVNISPNLANKIPTQNKNPISYLNKSVTNSLFLNPVT